MQLSKIACDALDEDGELAQVPDGNTSPAGVPISPEDGAVYRDASCLGNQFTRRIVTQVLPAVLVILWQNAIMPLTIYSIALFEKAQLSFSRLDRRILMLFFYWDMFNVFFGAIISGSIVNLVQRLIKSPGDIGVVLGASLPESSNFFINYLALRAFGLVPFRLILVHGGIWRWLFKCAPLAPASPPPPHSPLRRSSVPSSEHRTVCNQRDCAYSALTKSMAAVHISPLAVPGRGVCSVDARLPYLRPRAGMPTSLFLPLQHQQS